MDDTAALGLDTAAEAFATAAVGGLLDPAVQALITQAGALRHQPDQAQALLEQARTAAPHHPLPLIALYRFHFYGHRVAQARDVALAALALARKALGPQFGHTTPTDAQARHDAAVRFYLFTLKGLAYLNLRLGQLEPACQALTELKHLDPGDHVGAGVLGHVLHHALARADAATAPDDNDDSEPPVYPARGWGSATW